MVLRSYLNKIFILIGWGGRFLINPSSEQSIWWRSGLAEIASSPYVVYAFIKAIFKGKLLRTNFVTPKDHNAVVSYVRFFIPHMIIVAISCVCLINLWVNKYYFWQTQGMHLFLLMNILVMGGLTLTSTKWFQNLFRNRGN